MSAGLLDKSQFNPKFFSFFYFHSTCVKLIHVFCCRLSHLSVSPLEILLHLHSLYALTLLSPLVPVVPSQTNGAHYSRSKNSWRCHLIYFPPPLSLSRRFSFPKVPPLFLLFRASLGREVSNGVMACQLIYQLVEPCAALGVRRLQRDYGSGWQSPSAACTSRSLLYGQGATGQKVNMNQWPMFIRAGEAADVTLGFGLQAWNSPDNAGGKRQTVCRQNIYQGAGGDDHRGSPASFSGCICTKIQHCGKKWNSSIFNKALAVKGVQGCCFFFPHCLSTSAAMNRTMLLLQNCHEIHIWCPE